MSSRPTPKKSRVLPLPPEVRLGRSGLHGHGLFARDFIPEGAQIIEYLGVRITKAASKRIEAERLARVAAGKVGCVYIFDLNKRYDLDGDFSWNAARRINHSCTPNCEAQQSRGRIWLVALRDLAPGEELTFDYGFAYAEWRIHPCRCGTDACVGFIVNERQRWRVRRILAAQKR